MKTLIKRTSRRRANNRQRRVATLETLQRRQLLAADLLDAPDSDLAAELSTQNGANPDRDAVLRIVNGTKTSEFKQVGIVNDQCSGTLIAPSAVLTAAHCIDDLNSGTFQVGGETYQASKVYVHSDVDLAVMILGKPVAGVEPVDINRAPPKVGQMLTLVGFGATGSGNSGHNGNFGVKHVGTTPIDQVTSDEIIWNFDNNSESNTAPGDSGGPAFIEVNGQLLVAGVTSGGAKDDASIGDESYDVRVDALASWIDQVVAGGPVDDGTSDGDPINDDNGHNGDTNDDHDVVDLDDGFADLDDLDAETLAGEELQWLDANMDGKATREEMVAAYEADEFSSDEANEIADWMLEDFDTNNDDALDLTELIASYGPLDDESGDNDDIGDHDCVFDDEAIDDPIDDEPVDIWGDLDFGFDWDGPFDDFDDNAGAMQDDFGDLNWLDVTDGNADWQQPMDDESFSLTDDVWDDDFINFDDLDPCDVNGDGSVSPLDALMLVNRLGSGTPDSTTRGVDSYDVNSDGGFSSLDALYIINQLAINQPTDGAVYVAGRGYDDEGETVDALYATIGRLV